jgi:hypothetical protein
VHIRPVLWPACRSATPPTYIHPSMYTGHYTPSDQLIVSVSLFQGCWITSCNSFTRLGPPFFNSSAAIEFAPAALLFLRYFSAPIFLRGSANQFQLHYPSNRLDVLVAPIRNLRSSVLQNVLSISPALDFCWLIVPVIGSTHSQLWFKRSSNR